METSNTKADGFMWLLNTIGTNPSAPLASAPGFEPRHLTMSIIGGHGGLLERGGGVGGSE